MLRYWVFGKIFLGLVYLVISVVPECPPREDVYPCECHNDYPFSLILCRRVDGIHKFYPVLENTKGLNVYYYFEKSRLCDIASDFFKDQKSTRIYFQDCQIGSFGDRPFTGLENTLEQLSIEKSVDKKRKDLESFRLGHLNKLQSFNFEKNDIKRLGNDWFEGGPASLQILYLWSNNIEELGDRAFASLENLEVIMFGDNRIGKISRSMFPRPAIKLTYIDARYNSITDLPEDIFEDMPALKSILLLGNKLKSLPEATWGKIWDQLDEVDLGYNEEFECDENLKWIYQRRLPKILSGYCGNGKLFLKKLKDLTLADFD